MPHKFPVGDKVWLHLQKEYLEPLGNIDHSDMVFTSLPRLWETMHLSSKFPIPWPAPSVKCGPPSAILSTITRHIRHCKTTHTHIVKSRLHGTSCNWSDHGHTNQLHSPIEYPIVSSCQSRPAPSPGQVAHQGSSSAEVSSSDGGTQCNGDHCFLRGEEWSRWILMATLQFHLDPHHCFF